jgi:hypothetical protein
MPQVKNIYHTVNSWKKWELPCCCRNSEIRIQHKIDAIEGLRARIQTTRIRPTKSLWELPDFSL